MKTDLNTDFIELFKSETSFKKWAIFRGHIGFSMSVYPSVYASFRFVGTDRNIILFLTLKIGEESYYCIDVAKLCMFMKM